MPRPDEQFSNRPEERCDVLCIGSGAGGLSAAVTAGHLGAKVCVVEAAPLLGGAAAYSGGQIWVGCTDQAKGAGIEDSEQDIKSYLDWLSVGRSDSVLRDVYASRGPEVVRFLVERGVPLEVVREMPDYYFPEAPGSKAEGRVHETAPWDERQLGALKDRVASSPYGGGWVSTKDRIESGGQAPTPELAERRRRHVERGERCAGAGLVASLVVAAADLGATFHTDTRAVRLLVEKDRVVGVLVEDRKGRREIRAENGVVLATGGYGWDREMMRSLDGIEDVRSMAPQTARGDHFDLVAPLGGARAVPRLPFTSGVFIGTHTPGEERDGEPVYRQFFQGLPHAIIVNGSGRRFADDSFHMTTVAGIAGGRDGAEPNWPAWIVADQTYLDKYSMGALSPGEPVPEGMALSARSMAELGSAAGIDPAGLEDEVRRFNAFCADGKDQDFGRGSLPYTLALMGDPRLPNRNLGALEKPPFYAFPLTRIDVNCPAAGLVTGPDGDVRNADGEVVPGLYAAGNCVAQLDIGSSYNSGMGNQRGLLYGYLAATALARAASPVHSPSANVE